MTVQVGNVYALGSYVYRVEEICDGGSSAILSYSNRNSFIDSPETAVFTRMGGREAVWGIERWLLLRNGPAKPKVRERKGYAKFIHGLSTAAA